MRLKQNSKALFGSILTVAVFSTLNAQVNHQKLSPKGGGTIDIEPVEPVGAYITYGLLTFDKLPKPNQLNAVGIVPLNYVNEKTIYVHRTNEAALKKIPNYLSFELIKPEFKQDENVLRYMGGNVLDPLAVFVYLPNNSTLADVNRFVSTNNLKVLPCKSLPLYVLLVEAGTKEIESLSKAEEVSWITVAPDFAVKNIDFHFCPGGQTMYGPLGEFSANVNKSDKYATYGPGWDGAGQGCSDLTYYFANGTPDIAGNDERTAVRDALNTWAKYVKINFTEIFVPNQPKSIDISWETGNHGDGENNAFAGVGGVLAHGFLPNPPNWDPIAGNLHFDEADTWSLTTDIHLYSVALHELGHSLGMDHSIVYPAVMAAYYSLGTIHTDLKQDDIDGIRSIYSTRDPGQINASAWDKTFVGNVTGSAQKEMVMVNTSYDGGAIRVDNINNANLLKWYNHCNYQGWMDNSDKMFLADANGDGLQDLILVNTDYIQGAIRVIDLTTGADLSWLMHGTYGNWMDATDKMFVGDVNNDGKQELILVNTAYSGGAIRAVNMITGANISWINHGTFGGWMDPTDRILMGDVNNDNEEDLILINTSYAGGAIRTVDISSGTNLSWLNHNGTYGGWMDANDKVAVADMNNDGKDEVIFVNTDYAGGAIRAVNALTGFNYAWLMHGTYGGWMDACDRMFIADADNNGREDLILVNSLYAGGAIRSVDIASGTSLSWLMHGTYGGWMDATDRMFCEDINTDNKAEIILVNTGYTGGAIRAVNVLSGSNLSWISHTGTYNGWMDGVSSDQNCYFNPVFKSENLDAELNFELLEAAGWSENQTGFRTLIYPNPSSGLLSIQLDAIDLGEGTLRVMDIQGKVMGQKQVLQQGSNEIDLQSFPNGTYILEIVANGEVHHEKIQILK